MRTILTECHHSPPCVCSVLLLDQRREVEAAPWLGVLRVQLRGPERSRLRLPGDQHGALPPAPGSGPLFLTTRLPKITTVYSSNKEMTVKNFLLNSKTHRLKYCMCGDILNIISPPKIWAKIAFNSKNFEKFPHGFGSLRNFKWGERGVVPKK